MLGGLENASDRLQHEGTPTQAWADNQHSGFTQVDGELDPSLDRELDESDIIADDVTDVDATLAWLVPAVSATLNPATAEGTHDG